MEEKEVEDGAEPRGLEEPQVARYLIAGVKESCSGLSTQSRHAAYKYYN